MTVRAHAKHLLVALVPKLAKELQMTELLLQKLQQKPVPVARVDLVPANREEDALVVAVPEGDALAEVVLRRADAVVEAINWKSITGSKT